jgi:hypothetical protein
LTTSAQRQAGSLSERAQGRLGPRTHMGDHFRRGDGSKLAGISEVEALGEAVKKA